MKARVHCAAPEALRREYGGMLSGVYEYVDVDDEAELRRLLGRPREAGRYAGWMVDEAAPVVAWRVTFRGYHDKRQRVPFLVDAADPDEAVVAARRLAVLGRYNLEVVPLHIRRA